jgi:hypothetical protein
LSAVVARMLAKDPAQRFQTPLEVAQELTAFVKAGTKRSAAGISTSVPDVSSPGTGTVIAADTSKTKAILRDMPSKTPAQDAPAKDAATSAFEGLGEATASVKKKAKPARKAVKPAPRAWYRRGPMLAGVGAAVLALGLGAWLLAGVVFKTKVKTPNGEVYVVLEIDQPDAEVIVDGQKINVHVPGDNKPIEIQVEPGRSHKLRVRKDGFEAVTQDIELKTGKSPPIKIRLERAPMKPRDKDEEWIQKVAALPAETQVKAVADKLKERNPVFDGEVKPTIENGVVTGVWFLTDHVTDLSPLRALPQLESLSFGGSVDVKGRLVDLSPLKGMRLTSLSCSRNRAPDLSPLSGMKELEQLWITGVPLTDLKPLEGLKLRDLGLHATQVEDLSPLKGMPLKRLNIHQTRVKDLSPLNGMKLEWFCFYEQPVKDISVLKDMPLRGVECNFQRERDEAVLRSIKTLEIINRKPVAQFWKEVDGR